MNEMTFHPVANVFPLMSENEFANLCEDISANGLREEIWTFRGQIIDGRNRYNACLKIGVEPRFREWSGIGSLSSFVISLNLHRRHLTESQRGVVAYRIADMRQGERTDIPSIEGRLSQKEAAQQLGVSVSTVERASKVAQDGVVDLVERVEDGEISLSAAVQIAKLPKTKQKRLLMKNDKNKIVSLAQQIKVETTLKKAKTAGDICLVCNPPPAFEITDAMFKSHMILLAQNVGAEQRRYAQSTVDEMDELSVADDMLEDYELILGAIDAGFQTEADILRFVRQQSDIDMGILRYELKVMIGSCIELVPQGGKTDAARGQVKMLYQRKVHKEPQMDKDDKFEAAFSRKARKTQLRVA